MKKYEPVKRGYYCKTCKTNRCFYGCAEFEDGLISHAEGYIEGNKTQRGGKKCPRCSCKKPIPIPYKTAPYIEPIGGTYGLFWREYMQKREGC